MTCVCGHRRDEHEESENFDHPCLVCDCPDYEEGTGSMAEPLWHEGRPVTDIDPEALLATAKSALADRWPEFTMRTDRVIALAAALVEARARIEALEATTDVCRHTAQSVVSGGPVTFEFPYGECPAVHREHEIAQTLAGGLSAVEAERDRYRNAILDAITVLAAEHYPDPTLKGRGGCVMCWPKDGSWPCQSALENAHLRAALDEEAPDG